MNKTILLFGIIACLFMVGMVSAGTVTIDQPSADDEVTGSVIVNVTTDANDYVLNLTLTGTCTTLSGTTFTINETMLNTSAQQTGWNLTWVTTANLDCIQTITATAKNESGTAGTDTNTGIITNNTNPTVSFDSTSPSDTTVDISSGTFSVTSTEDLNSAYIKILNGQTYGLTSTNGKTWTYAFTESSNQIPEGTYEYMVVYDGTGTNDDGTTGYRTVSIDYGNGGGGFSLVGQEESTNKMKKIALVILIVGLVWLLMFNKK